MPVAQAFGKQDLALKYVIVLGCLIFITMVFAYCKLIYTKRRVRKCEKDAETTQLERIEELHILNQNLEGEEDLFGIRALEKGFYGGISQSRPGTPMSISSSTLAPPHSAHVVDRTNSEWERPQHLCCALAKNHATSRPGCNGSTEMHFVSPQVPATIYRLDRSRSPSPTHSAKSQTSTLSSTTSTSALPWPLNNDYCTSPCSPRNQASDVATCSTGGNTAIHQGRISPSFRTISTLSYKEDREQMKEVYGKGKALLRAHQKVDHDSQEEWDIEGTQHRFCIESGLPTASTPYNSRFPLV